MPVRIQGRLLAELGAVLGTCLAAAGCQSSAIVHHETAAHPAALVSTSSAKESTSLASFFRGNRDETPLVPQGQVVSMMRPVAVDPDAAPLSPITQASSWNPIQHEGAEQPAALPAVETTTAPVLASSPSPNILKVDAQEPPVAAKEAPKDTPMQLAAPTPLMPQTVTEMPGAGFHPLPPFGMNPPREFDKHSYPTYVIEPPDILLIQSTKGLLDQPVRIQTPVAMDGSVNLGTYGQVYVAGMTVDQVREAVTTQLGKRIKDLDVKNVSVEIAAYNSKVYYVITDGGGYGEQVARFPATGNETVLDALAQIGGLPNVASKKHVWLARATPGDATHPQIMPVDYCGVVQRGQAATNYQIFPGDRIYVGSDPWVRKDTWLARRLAPINQLFGTVLLGTTTVHSFKNNNSNNNSNGN